MLQVGQIVRYRKTIDLSPLPQAKGVWIGSGNVPSDTSLFVLSIEKSESPFGTKRDYTSVSFLVMADNAKMIYFSCFPVEDDFEIVQDA